MFLPSERNIQYFLPFFPRGWTFGPSVRICRREIRLWCPLVNGSAVHNRTKKRLVLSESPLAQFAAALWREGPACENKIKASSAEIGRNWPMLLQPSFQAPERLVPPFRLLGYLSGHSTYTWRHLRLLGEPRTPFIFTGAGSPPDVVIDFQNGPRLGERRMAGSEECWLATADGPVYVPATWVRVSR